MNEKDAKLLWCPRMKRGHVGNRSTNGFVRDDLSCIGSQCMAWRWKPDGKGGYFYDTGYCGLAGDL